MVLNFKFNVLLDFISVYFVFYISFDLFLSETKIYSTKICEFFVGSSRPPYTTLHKKVLIHFTNICPNPNVSRALNKNDHSMLSKAFLKSRNNAKNVRVLTTFNNIRNQANVLPNKTIFNITRLVTMSDAR